MRRTLMAYLTTEPEWLWIVLHRYGVTKSVASIGPLCGQSVYFTTHSDEEFARLRNALIEAHNQMLLSTLPPAESTL